jgi:hypothetical protein
MDNEGAQKRQNSNDRDFLPAPTGLAGLKNGDLLTAAEIAKFDVLLTVDDRTESCTATTAP